MARRNVRRIRWIANDNARQAALRRRRAKLHRKAEKLSTMCGASVVVLTHGSGEAEPTVWPAAPEAAAVLQRYAAPDSSSRATSLDHEQFLHRRIARLTAQVRRQKAANDEAMANLELHDVLRGDKNVADVPLELEGHLMMLVEKRLMEVAGTMYFRGLSVGDCPPAAQPAAPATIEEDGPAAGPPLAPPAMASPPPSPGVRLDIRL